MKKFNQLINIINDSDADFVKKHKLLVLLGKMEKVIDIACKVLKRKDTMSNLRKAYRGYKEYNEE